MCNIATGTGTINKLRVAVTYYTSATSSQHPEEGIVVQRLAKDSVTMGSLDCIQLRLPSALRTKKRKAIERQEAVAAVDRVKAAVADWHKSAKQFDDFAKAENTTMTLIAAEVSGPSKHIPHFVQEDFRKDLLARLDSFVLHEEAKLEGKPKSREYSAPVLSIDLYANLLKREEVEMNGVYRHILEKRSVNVTIYIMHG